MMGIHEKNRKKMTLMDDYHGNNPKDGGDESDDYADDASINEGHDQLLVFNRSEPAVGPHSLDPNTHMKSELS